MPQTPAKIDRSGGWIGRNAPLFVLPDTRNRPVVLADVWAKRPVVLIFYRGIRSQSCHVQFEEIGLRRADFIRSGASIYAISHEKGDALREMQRRHRLDFVTFLSDPTGSVAQKYGGVYAGKPVAQPTVFVIKKSKIVYAYLNADYNVRAPIDEILNALRPR